MRAASCVLQIDKGGRIIDLEANKAKLSIIEQEFKNAEMEEKRRLREEEEMRVRFGSCVPFRTHPLTPRSHAAESSKEAP